MRKFDANVYQIDANVSHGVEGMGERERLGSVGAKWDKALRHLVDGCEMIGRDLASNWCERWEGFGFSPVGLFERFGAKSLMSNWAS